MLILLLFFPHIKSKKENKVSDTLYHVILLNLQFVTQSTNVSEIAGLKDFMKYGKNEVGGDSVKDQQSRKTYHSSPGFCQMYMIVFLTFSLILFIVLIFFLFNK